MRGARKAFLILMAAVLLPSLAFAQGTLTGTVRDQSGGILPGVTVEASSPALIEKVRTGVSDGAGVYRITGLNPGTYSLTFTLPGFNVVRREGIELGGIATLTIPVEMRVGALEETITVTGETPVVDVQTVQRQAVLSADNDRGHPGNTRRRLLAECHARPRGRRHRTQRVADDDFLLVARRPDQRRPDGGQRHDGGGAVQRRRRVDLRPRLGQRRGGLGVRLRRHGRVGYRRAGDEPCAALGRQQLQRPGILQQRRRLVTGQQPDRRAARRWPHRDARHHQRLRRERLVRRPDQARSTVVLRQLPQARDGDAGPGGRRQCEHLQCARWDWVPDNNVTARQIQGRTMYIGRLTAQVSDKNRVSFSHEYQNRCEGSPLRLDVDGCNTRSADWIAAGTATVSPEANPNYFNTPYHLTQAVWSSPVTNKLLLEGGFSRFMFLGGTTGSVPPDGIFDLISVTEQSTAINPATGLRYAPRANYVYRGVPMTNTNYANPNMWRASASYVTGSHDLKVGYQGAYIRVNFTNGIPESQLSYRFSQGVPNQFTFRLPTWRTADRTSTTAIYIQDRWTRGRLTLQGALRYDRASSFSPAEHNGTELTSKFNAAPFIFERTAGVDAFNDITPRMGVAYDLFGNGKTALKFNLGHYLDAATNDSEYTSNSPQARIVRTAARNWQDTNNNKVIDCDILNPVGQNTGLAGSIVVPGGDVCAALTGNDLNFGKANLTTTVNPETLTGWGVRQNDWHGSTGRARNVNPCGCSAADRSRFGTPGSHPREAILGADLEDRGHLRRHDDERVADGGGRAGEPGARSARHDREAVVGRGTHARHDVLRGPRERHELARPLDHRRRPGRRGAGSAGRRAGGRLPVRPRGRVAPPPRPP